MDLSIGLPDDLRFVDSTRALAMGIACRDLSAFAAKGKDANETFGGSISDKAYAFTVERVALSATPGGPALATLGTRERKAYVVEQRGDFARLWIELDEMRDVAIRAWVPSSSIISISAEEEAFGWGTIEMSNGRPELRYCESKVVVWLVRVGEPGRVLVGAIAPVSSVEIAADAEVPAGMLALGEATIGWLRLAEGARLVIADGACR